MRARRTPVGLLAATLVLALTGCGAAADRGPERARDAAETDPTLHSQLPPEVRDAGVLTVATDATYAPASFFGPDGRTVVGFEADLATALGDVLGVDVEFVVTGFDELLDDVDAHRVDVAMSAMTDTPDRQRRADFVNYFRAGTSILVQRGNPRAIADLADLCGEVVAVESGTVQVDLLERSQRRCAGGQPITVSTYPTNADALVELRTGRAAAVLNDYPPAAYLTTDPRTQADYQLASDTQYEPGLYGVAVARDRRELRDAVQSALERLLASGVYREILRSWDVDDGAVDTVTVNGGAPAGG